MPADLELTVDLTKRQLTTSLSEFAPLVLRDGLRCALKFTRNLGGSDVTVNPVIRSLQAAIGPVGVPAKSGKFSLASHRLDATSVAIADVDVQCDADAMTAKLAGLGWVESVERIAPGVWVLATLIADSEDPPPDFTTTANSLEPVSLVTGDAYSEEGFWMVELSALQMPIAFANSFDRVLGAAPKPARVRAGGASGPVWVDEIQSITIPPDFAGLYSISFDYRKTAVLGLQDGAERVAKAFNALWTDGKIRMTGSLPQDDTIYLTFTGPLGATGQELIGITVENFAPGVVTFTLDLDQTLLRDALRTQASVTLPFEVRAMIMEDGQDPEDMELPARRVTLFQSEITLTRDLIRPVLATVDPIDWVRPPVAKNYVPRTADQILIGTQATYVSPRGNGTLRSFVCDHGLATEDIISVVVKNNATGVALVHGTAFAWTVTNANTVTVDVVTGWATPGAAAWVIEITSAGPATAFQSHTHTMGQIIGLLDALNTIGARLDNIEVLLPTAPPTVNITGGEALTIPLSDLAQLVPGRWRADFDPKAAFANGTRLPARGYGLLPAIHDAAATNAILPLPAATDHAGELFVNNTGDPITLPGGLGRRSSLVAAGGFYGSDGRVWYALTRDTVPAGTNSYFPRDFERELFRIAVSEKMLRAGQSLACEFDLTLAMLKADTAAQWMLVIECGAATQDTSPATTGENLADLTWQTTPLLSERIVLTAASFPAKFGVTIARNAAGSAITASKLLYGQFEASGTQPASPNFTLRARLVQFDTQNSVPGARGWAYFEFANATAKIS